MNENITYSKPAFSCAAAGTRTIKQGIILLLLVLYTGLFAAAQGAKQSAKVKPVSEDSVRAVQFPNGKWGFITSSGKTLIPGQYDMARNFFDGLAVVGKADRFFYINIQNKNVFGQYFESSADFEHGYACVGRKDSTSPSGYIAGLINTRGELVIPYQYLSNFYFTNGLAFVENRERQVLYIDYQGKVFDTLNRQQPKYYLSKEIAIVTHNKRYGLINVAGDTISPLQSEQMNFYLLKDAPQFIRLERNGKWGVIDKEGKTVIPFLYDYISEFTNGLARVQKGGLYGYIDRKGTIIIPFRFSHAEDFAEGLALVQSQNKFVFIDTAGKIRITVDVSSVETQFKRGLVGVMKEKNGFLRKDGSFFVVK